MAHKQSPTVRASILNLFLLYAVPTFLSVLAIILPLYLTDKLNNLIVSEAGLLAVILVTYFSFLKDQLVTLNKTLLGTAHAVDAYFNSTARCDDRITKQDFYKRLLNKIGKAELKIKLMYLGRESPAEDPDIKEYANRVNSLLREKVKIQPNLVIQRIILDTAKNRQWIVQNCEDFDNNKQFSLGLVPEDRVGCSDGDAKKTNTNPPEKKPMLSVQIIDDEHVFIVDPTDDVSATRKYSRYLYLHSKHAAEVFDIYFDCIMKGSTKIINNGTRTSKARDYCLDTDSEGS